MQQTLFPALHKVAATLYFHHYTVQLRAQEDCTIDYFIGDMLRDSFLYACSRVMVKKGRKEITLFELLDSHHYQTAAALAASGCKNKRKGFALDISPVAKEKYRAGEVLSFGIVLMGKHNQQLPAVLQALQLMAKKGIGRGKLKFSLYSFSETNISGPGRLLYRYKKPAEAIVAAHPIRLTDFAAAHARKEWLQVNYLSPTMFDDRGHLTGSYSFKTLLQKTISRIADAALLYAGATAAQYKAAQAETEAYLQQTAMPVRVAELQWHELPLPGGKRNEALLLRGHTGRMVYTGKFNFYLDVLLLAQWLQTGDNTTYGFGKISVEYE
ncbi:MAG TPA: CRISPR system precrRNA processing endoribonuclease RAMP protein Cas6 [Chitinophagaceae bacterium]|jgi:hypothetical protein|nr:CRISPR system precrRNA processing endoribonuclease RAMP protein Cas6 [Chitinophagaceae bacterium]HMU59592.1 CRISPR system precrRNA processing endoribonuclease RAMP protein Cas6 [Chitinophagaceae bacterium]